MHFQQIVIRIVKPKMMSRASRSNGAEEESLYDISEGNRRNRSVTRQRRICLNNIKMDFREIKWVDKDCLILLRIGVGGELL